MRPLLAAALLLPGLAHARTLTVGEGKEFPRPSAAIQAAQEGDTVLIDPGQYFDCAEVSRNGLVIAGAGPGAVLTDKACQGKALLVINGDGVTIRDLTLARARVPDGNGAGIRLQAPSLTLQRVTFLNDQVGLLSAASSGTIRIEESTFQEGGVPGLYAVMAGDAASLRVAGSTFAGVAGGQINTAASRSEIVGNTIATGFGDTPSPAILATAGTVLIADNTLTIGPNRPWRDAAVALWDDASGTLRGNRMVNQTGHAMTLLLDWSWGSPALTQNTVAPGDDTVSTSGIWRHRASTEYHYRRAQARSVAGGIKRFIQRHLP